VKQLLSQHTNQTRIHGSENYTRRKSLKCVICKHGDTKEGTTTVTFDRDGRTLAVKDVPAQVCTNCIEDYVDEQVVHEILTIGEQIAKNGPQVDVRRYVLGSAMPC